MHFLKAYILPALFLVVAGTGGIALAEEHDVNSFKATELFCDNMKDEALYDENKFLSYKFLIAGKEDWIFRSQSDFKTDFSLPKPTLDLLQEINNAMSRRGVNLVMLLTPTRAMMHPGAVREGDRRKYGYSNLDAIWKSYNGMIESLRKRGIDTVGIERISDETSFFYHMDHHWNPDGARMAAKTVATYVKALREYQDIPKVKFITREAGEYDFEGVSKKVFKKLCKTKQPPERIIRYVTEQAGASSAESELFGDAPVPGIVLLGTSNSTMEPSNANFEGFLKEELEADVLNMSVSGGGLDTAMITYLTSSYYRDNPSKIAIWEIPSYYDIKTQKSFFREAVAGAYGSCKGKEVAGAENTPITDQTVYALEKLTPKKISGGQYYAEIVFSEPITKAFSVDFRYRGNKDRFRFSRSGRAANPKVFYVELNREKKEHLDKIMLAVPEEMIGKSVSVRVCKKPSSRNFL